jgi:large repetitive protein
MKYAILTMSFLILGLVSAKPLAIEFTKKEISCFGKKDGQLDLIIHGGKAPFSIQLNGKPTGAVISELGAGCYDVQVRDAKG